MFGNCLKQDRITITYRKTVKISISETIGALGNFLFGAAKLVKNADIDEYKYSRYGTGFDMKKHF